MTKAEARCPFEIDNASPQGGIRRTRCARVGRHRVHRDQEGSEWVGGSRFWEDIPRRGTGRPTRFDRLLDTAQRWRP